jgi:hypothetical protein
MVSAWNWRSVVESAIVCLALLTGAEHAAAQQFGEWSIQENLGEKVNSSALDGCPAISRDGLSLYFASRRNNAQQDLYVAQRANIGDRWEEARPININHPTADDFCPALSVDGHFLYFASTRPDPYACGGQDLFVARRQDKRDDFAWETPDNLGCQMNSAANDFGPNYFEDADGTPMLYFSSNGWGGAGGNDIFMSRRGSDGTWGAPENVWELNTGSSDQQSSIRQRDGLEIVFTSNRPGSTGFDLWTATRSSQSDPWSDIRNLGSLNTAVTDARPALSWDGTELFFHSNRAVDGASRAEDIYVSTREKQPRLTR